jgi:hypothetical protein
LETKSLFSRVMRKPLIFLSSASTFATLIFNFLLCWVQILWIYIINKARQMQWCLHPSQPAADSMQSQKIQRVRENIKYSTSDLLMIIQEAEVQKNCEIWKRHQASWHLAHNQNDFLNSCRLRRAILQTFKGSLVFLKILWNENNHLAYLTAAV